MNPKFYSAHTITYTKTNIHLKTTEIIFSLSSRSFMMIMLIVGVLSVCLHTLLDDVKQIFLKGLDCCQSHHCEKARSGYTMCIKYSLVFKRHLPSSWRPKIKQALQNNTRLLLQLIRVQHDAALMMVSQFVLLTRARN